MFVDSKPLARTRSEEVMFLFKATLSAVMRVVRFRTMYTLYSVS